MYPIEACRRSRGVLCRHPNRSLIAWIDAGARIVAHRIPLVVYAFAPARKSTGVPSVLTDRRPGAGDEGGREFSEDD